MEEIERRLGEPLTIERLAGMVNLSPSRFSHLFCEQVGVPPMRFVRDRRMVRASLLLERTFLSVKEVMGHVGCCDPSHFARDFRAYHGVPPHEWRAVARARTHEPFSTGVYMAADSPAESRQQDTPAKSGFRSRTRPK
jgi:AraC-like DNA-binding protein